MTNLTSINILIAEDNDISRELMASILRTQGYNIICAADGKEAITAVGKDDIDLALVDLNMEPTGGFEFVRHLIVSGMNIPVMIITADESSDVLTKAGELGVTRVMQKPVDPEKLCGAVKHVLKRYGHNPQPLAVEKSYQSAYTPEQLMQRAVELAESNARNKKGGPFGAVIANEKGEVLGEGTNGITSRVDPTAHAEIMAIRQAAEKLGRAHLEDCILYCSSEPTMMGQALIVSVGIRQVYFGLKHAEINAIRKRENVVREELSGAAQKQTTYTQLGHDHAMTVFQRWQAMGEKLED